MVANHTIAASFVADAVPIFTINATAGPNGTINPSGLVTVQSGTNRAFTITPNAGYQIADVRVDGVSVGAVGSYSFTSVSANHTINASFRVQVQPLVKPLPGMLNGPTDPDKDGIYEDMNGDGRVQLLDAYIFLRNLGWIQQNQQPGFFDFNRNGVVNFLDVFTFISELEAFGEF